MAQFAVIRHPEAGLGTAPAESMELYLARGWVRVSDYAAEPSAFHLPDFTDAPDLDAPEPAQEPKKAPAKTTKESTE